MSPVAATETEEDSTVATRPSLYIHKPQMRVDELDRMRREGGDVLDALKLQSMEGFYNLSFILLIFSLAYIVIRNLVANGLMASWQHFTCSQVRDDALLVGAIVGASSVWCLTFFFATKLFVRRYINGIVFVVLCAMFQVRMHVWLRVRGCGVACSSCV